MAATPAPKRAHAAAFDDVKVAFLLQFTNYVTWPEGSFEEKDSPLVICIEGNDDVYNGLREKVKGKKAGSHPIKVVREVSGACHIAFIDEANSESTREFIDKHGTEPILTVGANTSFTKDGGIIRLFIEDAKPRIEINVGAAEKADIKISSKLLKLAIIYDT